MRNILRSGTYLRIGLCVVTLIFVMGQAAFSHAQDKVKLGYSVSDPGFSEIGIWLARDSGMFKKQGLDVEIIMLNGDNIGMSALLSDSIDIVNFSNTLNYTAIEKGAPFKTFLETTPVHDYIFVTSEKIKKWEDFIGRAVAISTPGSVVHLMAQAAFKRHGIDSSKVMFLPVGGSGARTSALIAGKVDGGLLHVEDAVAVSKQKGIHNFANLATEIPEYQFVNFVTKIKTISERRPMLVKFTRVLLEANRFIVKNKDNAIEVYRKYHKEMDYETSAKIYDMLLTGGLFGVNGGMSRDSYNYTQESMVSAQQLKALIPYNKVYDTSIVEDVLKEIGVIAGKM